MGTQRWLHSKVPGGDRKCVNSQGGACSVTVGPGVPGFSSCTAGLPEVSASSMSCAQGRPPAAGRDVCSRSAHRRLPSLTSLRRAQDVSSRCAVGALSVEWDIRYPLLSPPHPEEPWSWLGWFGRAADPTSELRARGGLAQARCPRALEVTLERGWASRASLLRK